MVIEQRVAKIGKGNNVNLYAKKQDESEIYFYNQNMIKKSLNVESENYELTTRKTEEYGVEIIKLEDDLMLLRTNNSISLKWV